MKMKRLAALTATLVVLGAGIVYAGSPWGEYQGYTKVRVQVNNTEVPAGDVPAFMIDGRVVLPLRELSDSLNAIVKWDDASKTAYLYKPNVHMFVAKDIAKDDSPKTPFGKVSKGNKLDFVVAAQVDSLTTPIQSFKIDLVSPEGAIIRSTNAVTLQGGKDSFWYSWPLESVTFDSTGKYKVQFKIKLDDAHEYSVVSEKTIVSE
ncbi:stalk domain-containing protein [Paenibacillus hodogayensis]|uniref:Stalk domain-containing protein n=1 Tax=Paenibacillus hodogayensis TaxID=279208 RepID=A0ABV5VPW0_9BACL